MPFSRRTCPPRFPAKIFHHAQGSGCFDAQTRLLQLKHLWGRGVKEHNPLSPEEKRCLLSMAGKRAGWDDPEMDVYNAHAAH
jgi:hypothetical protein